MCVWGLVRYLEFVKGPSESAGVLEINSQIHGSYFCSVALESFGLGICIFNKFEEIPEV